MKYLFCIMFFLPSLISAQEKGIHFEQGLTWAEVKEKAQQEGKYIFMDCYASWCGPCKEMDRDIYTNERLGEYMNTHFVSIKVQMDTSRQDNENVQEWYSSAQNIRNEFKINAFPSYLFFSPSALIVHRDLGYKNVNEFTATVKTAGN